MIRKIRQYLRDIWPGLGQVMVISPDRAYIAVRRILPAADQSNLRQDARRLGNDLVKKVKEYPNGNPSKHK